MRPTCPHCGHLIVQPNGSPKADFLLMGPFPGHEEQTKGYPWVGKAGEVLKAELGRVGLSYPTFRATNLWQHRENEDCNFEWHLDAAFQELLGRRAILLMGALTCDALLGKHVTDVSSLRVTSKYIPLTTIVIASVNPADAISPQGSVGEIRLSIRNFAAAIREIKA